MPERYHIDYSSISNKYIKHINVSEGKLLGEKRFARLKKASLGVCADRSRSSQVLSLYVNHNFSSIIFHTRSQGESAEEEAHKEVKLLEKEER